MSPNTDTTAPIFVSDRPDWNKQVLVDRSSSTSIFTSENATEQRQRKRLRGKIGISYQIEAMSPPEAFAREVKLLQELAAPVVIPVWPYSLPIAGQDGPVLTTGSLEGYPIRAGWVFIEDDNGEGFYSVLSFDSSGTITLSGTVPEFSNGILYPCIVGTRRDGASTIMTQHTESSETMAVDEL
jgi:hypothetical protein